jgi:hypothetical protein
MMPDGFVRGIPRVLLRIEGAGILGSAVGAYVWLGQPWWMFAVLILAPDLSMLGYVAGPRFGAVLYNALHTLAGPLIALGLAASLHQPVFAGVALIWLAHVGLDRMLGYGLKYGSGFSDTHLGALGRRHQKVTAS